MLTTHCNTSPPTLALGKAPPATRAPSRILFLFSEAESLRRAEQPVSAEAERVRNGLIRRHGEPHTDAVRAAWDADPALLTLQALNDESESLIDAFIVITDELLALPATTIPELHAKLRVVAWEQPTLTDGLDHYEVQTIGVLAEFERFVGGAA